MKLIAEKNADLERLRAELTRPAGKGGDTTHVVIEKDMLTSMMRSIGSRQIISSRNDKKEFHCPGDRAGGSYIVSLYIHCKFLETANI